MSKNNYTQNTYIRRINPDTGEFEYYKRVYDYRRSRVKGYRVFYPDNLEYVLENIQGRKPIDILFYIFKMFTKRKIEVPINQSKLAKQFETSKQYVNKIMRQFVDLEVLIETRRTRGGKIYRLNPYIVLPQGPTELHVMLQDEWDILTNAPAKIKDKFEYIHYLLYSDEWKELAQRVKSEAGFKCSECGSRENLEVHHLTYDRLFNEEIEDLICLCSVCHENRHRE